MRLREKMGAKEQQQALPGDSGVTGNSGSGRRSGDNTVALAKDGRRGRRDNGNIGDYTRTLWSSLGAAAGDAAPTAGASGASGVAGGGGMAAAEDVGTRSGGGNGRTGIRGLYWVGEEVSNQSRLVAFTETLAAGESALSPGVFEVGGGRRAEVGIFICAGGMRSTPIAKGGLGAQGGGVTTRICCLPWSLHQ